MPDLLAWQFTVYHIFMLERFLTSFSLVWYPIWNLSRGEHFLSSNVVLLPTCAERFSEIWSKSDNIHYRYQCYLIMLTVDWLDLFLWIVRKGSSRVMHLHWHGLIHIYISTALSSVYISISTLYFLLADMPVPREATNILIIAYKMYYHMYFIIT